MEFARLAFARFNPALQTILVHPVTPTAPENLPQARTQQGNLFTDCIDASLFWYLPDFALTADPDPVFGFTASRTEETDEEGRPFHAASLTLSLQKKQPADVLAFQAARGRGQMQLREIPLRELAAILTITHRDSSTGSRASTSFPGKTEFRGEVLALTFDNVLGANVIALCQQLKQGGAEISLAAKYDVWRSEEEPRTAVLNEARASLRLQPVRPAVALSPTPVALPHDVRVRAAFPRVAVPPSSPPQQATLAGGEKGTAAFAKGLSLEEKYARGEYQMKYALVVDGQTRVIIGTGDLRDFDIHQSQYVECLALGDISTQYPTLQKLYVGPLSRSMVVVPRDYVIARTGGSCEALCAALLDTSPQGASRCKFEFRFDLAPRVSPLDLLRLQEEVARRDEFKGYTLELPESLSSIRASTLVTSFASTCTFTGATTPARFSLCLTITQTDDTPPVVNANMLIKLLGLAQTYLSGTMQLKLDDSFAPPVEANLHLGLQETAGTDDFTWNVDETGQRITLTNGSRFDFLITRYALCTEQGSSIMSLNQKVEAKQTAFLPLPTAHTHLQLVLEYVPVKQDDISRGDVQEYLELQVADVQEVQYRLGVNASSTRMRDKGVKRIEAQIGLPALPSIPIAAFWLEPAREVSSTVAQVPLLYAVTSLAATLQFTVHYEDAAKASYMFTAQHDFLDDSTYYLRDQEIPA